MTAVDTDKAAADTSGGPVWTVEKIRALGVRTDVQTAGAILGLGRTKAYQLVREGQFPVPVVRVGRRLVVPTAGILALLGAG